MGEVLLEARDIGVSRGENLLFQNQSFTLAAGQALQLQGENGSGKTTLLRALATLIPLDEGELRWRGQTLPRARDEYFAQLCFAGHRAGIKDNLNAIENIKHSGLHTTPTDEACSQALQRTGLVDREHLPCRVLSAGQRRRVLLARVILSGAALWLLDEPLSALDTSGVALLSELVTEHLHSGGAVVYSTHQPLPLGSVNVATLQLAGNA